MEPGNPLEVYRHRDVILAPFEGAAELRFGFRMGAFTPDGEPIERFRLNRFRGPSEEPRFRPAETRLDMPVRYGGVIIDHFGHFLLESLARYWWLGRDGQEPIIWHSARTALLPWQIEIFELLRLSWREFLFISAPSQVREIANPEPGFAIGLLFHPSQVAALAVWPFAPARPDKRVWLSRSALSRAQGHVVDEASIEQALLAAGWLILHPETMSIRDQLSTLEDAALIAGFEGSAFHILILARDCKAELRIVGRQPKTARNFALIATAKNLRQTIFLPELRALSDEGPGGSYALENPEAVLSFLLQ